MKKILAVLVAVLMMALPFASAQEAFYFADPVLSMGEGMDVDLTGLELVFAGGLAGEKDAVKIIVNGNGETLFTIDINVVGTTVLMSATGLSNVYSFTMPEEMGQGLNLDFSNFKLPDEVVEQVTGIVLGAIEIDEETGEMRIPYTAVNDILELVAPYLDQVNIPGMNVDDLIKGLAQMKESDSGIDLRGSFGGDEDGSFTFDFSAYMVDGGVIADEAAFGISMAMAEGSFAMNIDAGEQGNVTIGLEGEQLSIAFVSNETQFSLTGKAGNTDVDVDFVELDGTNAIDFNTLSEEDSAKLSEEFMAGAGALISFVMGALGVAA